MKNSERLDGESPKSLTLVQRKSQSRPPKPYGQQRDEKFLLTANPGETRGRIYLQCMAEGLMRKCRKGNVRAVKYIALFTEGPVRSPAM